MNFYIKNMICNRCIMVVQQVFESLGYPPVRISLGNVEIANPVENDDLEKLRKSLESYGFELIDDAKSRILKKLRTSWFSPCIITLKN